MDNSKSSTNPVAAPKKERLLILTERFYPEEFLINDLAEEWSRRGIELEVLTQVPSYPKDEIFSGYRNLPVQTTTEFHGIHIHRVRTVLGYNHSVFKKVWNYISFACRTSLWALIHGYRYSRVFTFYSGPLTMAMAGALIHLIYRRPTMIWTQDLWPDAVYHYGVKPNFFTRHALSLVVKAVYAGYTKITVSCPGFIPRLANYTKKAVTFFPQWAAGKQESLETMRLQGPEVPKHQGGGGRKEFVFAGNLGSVQNLERLVDAFGNVPEVRLRIAGGGVELEPLKRRVAEKNIKNIEFLGRRPQKEMPMLFDSADILVISLKSSFNLTIPSKFQAYIACGRPILAALAGDTAELVKKYDLGVVADPDRVHSITDAIRQMAEASPEVHAQWAANALTLSESMFNRECLIDAMAKMAME